MDEESTRAIIWRHMRDIGTCMMVTHTHESMQSRPMRGLLDKDSNIIWFFTDRESGKTAEAQEHREACLAFANCREQNFVSVTGRLDVVDDREQLKRLWTEGAELYFPAGEYDESVVLLRFSPVQAEYWDAPSNPIALAIKFLQAKVTGERPVLGKNDSTWMS
jgi:general stress protein 26